MVSFSFVCTDVRHLVAECIAVNGRQMALPVCGGAELSRIVLQVMQELYRLTTCPGHHTLDWGGHVCNKIFKNYLKNLDTFLLLECVIQI